MTGMTNKKEGGYKGPLPLKSGDYVRVVSKKGLDGSGLKVGDHLLIAGLKVLPEKRSDPYLQRTYSMCLRVEDGVHLLPSEDNEEKIILVDPRKLELLPEEITEVYKKNLENRGT